MPITIEVPASTLRCLRVRHEPAEVSVVRRRMHDDLLRDPRTAAVADDVAVVTSELVGNAVRHGSPLDGGLLVRWRVSEEGVAVEVVDGGGSGEGPAAPVEARDADPLATSGRGLRIVEHLTRRWGTSLDAEGRRTVWAVIAAEQPAGRCRRLKSHSVAGCRRGQRVSPRGMRTPSAVSEEAVDGCPQPRVLGADAVRTTEIRSPGAGVLDGVAPVAATCVGTVARVIPPVPARLVYLGPAGTFTELAASRAPGAEGAERVAVPSVDAALAAVRSGDADLAVVPIENSVEGGVTSTLDALGAGRPLSIRAEVLVQVAFVLAARPGTSLADVERVGSHPHALAQCRGWLAANLPHATTVPALSTAAAAQALAVEAAPGAAPYDAALCAAPAAEAAGLEVLADDVADNAGAITRFVVVSRPAPPPAPTGADKTTVVAHLAQDRSGALLELLEQFATRGVNLTRIESRPIGTALGRYTFSLDCEGHIADPRVGEALMGLHRVCPQVRYLGSYPRADGLAPVPPPGTADTEFTAARAWLGELLAGGEPLAG